MSSIKSVIEKHANTFNEINRFNEVISKVIDKELTRLRKEGKLESRYFIELMPTLSDTYLVALKKTADPTAPEITSTTFESLFSISIYRNVLKKSYGIESIQYSNTYKCNVYYYLFDFVKIASK